MDSRERQPAEQALFEPRRETLRRAWEKADILVHMECRDAAPVDPGLDDQRVDHVLLAWCRGENHPHAGRGRKPGADFHRDVVRRRPAHERARGKGADPQTSDRSMMRLFERGGRRFHRNPSSSGRAWRASVAAADIACGKGELYYAMQPVAVKLTASGLASPCQRRNGECDDDLTRRREAPTISQVAEAAGVSRASVSRAFTRPEMLSAKTVRRVKAVAQRIGYVPNHTARALSTGRHGNVALVVPMSPIRFFHR